MNTHSGTNSPARDTQAFYVSYFPGEPESLHRDVGDGHQFYQDAFVVEATGYEHALESAFELLEARYDGPFTIAKVIARAEVESMLRLMNRVDRGEVRPATMADEGNDVWIKRYLEDCNNDPNQPLTL